MIFMVKQKEEAIQEKNLPEKPAKSAKEAPKAETKDLSKQDEAAAQTPARPSAPRHSMQRTSNASAPYMHAPEKRQPNGAKPMDARELNKLSVEELTKLAVNYNIEDISGLRKQALIGKIVAIQAKQNGSVYGGGVLEILPDGFGFLRSEENNYLAGPEDIYVSPSQIKRFGLRKGDTIEGLIRPPKDNERFFAMLQVQKVNGVESAQIYNRPLFENLTPLHPNERFVLELDKNSYTQRVIDMIAPIGKGQRALIVAAPKTGKTMIMQAIANSITTNHKDAVLMVLLIDERPEEVTDMARSVKGEVISSTFDEAPERHIQVAEMDEVIFEEFKGTGNSELCLDRKLAERRIFPAVDINRSSTRKENLLLSEDELNKVWIMRKVLAPLSSVDAMNLLLEKLSATKSNKDFFKQMEVNAF